jgi:hypothetical protein
MQRMQAAYHALFAVQQIGKLLIQINTYLTRPIYQKRTNMAPSFNGSERILSLTLPTHSKSAAIQLCLGGNQDLFPR